MAARQSTRADEDRRQLVASPIYRATREFDVPVDLFESDEPRLTSAARRAMDHSRAVAERHLRAGTTFNEDGVVAPEVVAELADAGYWGLRAGVEFGGTGASFGAWAPFVAQIASVDPWVAGMASTHAALGPVNLLGTFGTAEQKARLLPPLAAGRRLGAFAVTEPGTASDWGAIRAIAIRDGDQLLLTGEKMFITNAAAGRTIAVLCKIDGRLSMVAVEAPWQEDDWFRTVCYGIRAPSHITNRALIFRELPVPAGNILEADGRRVAYHGLNHGRVLVCAFAAGMLRSMAGTLIPWVRTRETFGALIGKRELVQRRLGRLAGRIVATDAMVAWAAQLLDQGYRGELECVTAKVFGSEAAKEAAVDLLLKTQGSRAFLPGNAFSEAVHDILALSVLEGENEIITLGFLSSLVKARLAHPPATLRAATRVGAVASLELDELTAVAAALLQESGRDIDDAIRHHGAALAKRQAAAAELAQRAQLAAVMLVVARYGSRQADPLVRQAATCIGSELGQRLTGAQPTPTYHRWVTLLGAAMADNQFAPVAATTRGNVVMPDHVEIPMSANR